MRVSRSPTVPQALDDPYRDYLTILYAMKAPDNQTKSDQNSTACGILEVIRILLTGALAIVWSLATLLIFNSLVIWFFGLRGASTLTTMLHLTGAVIVTALTGFLPVAFACLFGPWILYSTSGVLWPILGAWVIPAAGGILIILTVKVEDFLQP